MLKNIFDINVASLELASEFNSYRNMKEKVLKSMPISLQFPLLSL